jgi:neutral trehalase
MKHIGILLFILFMTVSFVYADVQYGAFDPEYWNGLVLLKDHTAFAFRFAMLKSGRRADGYDTFYIVERVGPFTPDGSYAEVSFNPFLPFGRGKDTRILEKKTPPIRLVNLRCAKYRSGVVGVIESPLIIDVEVLFYTPFEKQAPVQYREAGKHIVGEKNELTFYFVPIGCSFARLGKEKNTIIATINRDFDAFYFYAGFEKPKELTFQKIEEILRTNRKNYNSRRPKVTGEWEGLIASISNNLAWMKLYQPDKKRVYLPAGRRWIFPGPEGKRDLWTIFEWDAFFNALEAVVEDRELAKMEIEAVLDTQYPWGNIPNWRSANSGAPDRSQPPVGSYAVLKTYLRTHDMSLLSNSYEGLKKWHEFWRAPGINGNPRRDGNEDGLLEWGSDADKLFEGMPKWEQGVDGRQRAAWESGEDDLPNYDGVPFDDQKGTLKMNCIDLSSLYALDTEMLMRMASILGKKEDAEAFKKEYEAIKEKINRVLWDRDFYFDRSWDEKFSTHKAASNFYPMIAGVPDKDRVSKIVNHLQSEKEFWGDYVIPTISRDNPAFKDQQYWRGTIWPPTNYLVYQGLKRYGLDKIASEFAVKSAKLFLKSWRTFQLCRENYNSVTGEGGGQRYQSWGPLFALILLEDFIDVCPFDGFRVGNLSALTQTKIENLEIRGSTYTLEADSRGLALFTDQNKLFEYKGKAVLRDIEVTKKRISFEANVISDAVDFYPSMFKKKSFKVELDGKKAGKKKGFVSIPKGAAKVVLKR